MLARKITRTKHTIRRLVRERLKVRGITLNYSASQLVNFAKMKDMILSKDDDETVIMHTKNKIKRKKSNGGVNIISEPKDKTYTVSFLKRRRLNDNTSLPFGYINGERLLK